MPKDKLIIYVDDKELKNNFGNNFLQFLKKRNLKLDVEIKKGETLNKLDVCLSKNKKRSNVYSVNIDNLRERNSNEWETIYKDIVDRIEQN